MGRLEDRVALVTGGGATARAFAVKCAVDVAGERFGGLHVAFANAGIFGSHAPVADYPEDEFDRTMAVNVRGSFLVVKHAMAAMGDGPGAIVIDSSVGLTPPPRSSATRRRSTRSSGSCGPRRRRTRRRPSG